MGHAHTQSAAGRNKRPMALVFGLTITYLVVEVIGGLITGSLVLLADAGHMLSDSGGIGLALMAISLYILYESYRRFMKPPEVESGLMLGVAVVGLVVNIIGMYILRTGSRESLNMEGAYFEVLSDMLTSIGVIFASVIMLTTGWYYADPLISAGIGLFILPRTWLLLREALGVLLEGTPSDVNLTALRESIRQLPGVVDVHDLHVWTLTSGINAMSTHAVLVDDKQHDQVLQAVRTLVFSKFK